MNLALSLAYAAERHPEHEALVDGDVRLTYAALRERAARLARGLESLGLARGDRLAAVLTNRHETVELYWASQWLGAVFVPLSCRAAGHRRRDGAILNREPTVAIMGVRPRSRVCRTVRRRCAC